MGLAVPRPAMRAREERVIRARLEHYNSLVAMGVATNEAFKAAQALKFTRDGKPKKEQNK